MSHTTRRQFVQTGAAAATALALPEWANAQANYPARAVKLI